MIKGASVEGLPPAAGKRNDLQQWYLPSAQAKRVPLLDEARTAQTALACPAPCA